MHPEFLATLQTIRKNKGLPPLDDFAPGMRWREDLGFDSLDLAELTVRLEARFGIDIFADGLVHTLGEANARLPLQ